MEITSVNVRKIEKEGSRMKGIASVLLDDSFVVHDIRIIEGDNGLFIAMPSRKTPTGGYRDIAHPINPEVRSMFEEAIIKEYENTEDEEEAEEDTEAAGEEEVEEEDE
ncbi:MAG: septation regulator SpoVG [Bacilli bacterium]|nr:septation regulator SpoVG [Bacilli bacterium]